MLFISHETSFEGRKKEPFANLCLILCFGFAIFVCDEANLGETLKSLRNFFAKILLLD